MSLYEQALEEWKKQDPYLENFEGFQRFLEDKEKEVHVRVEVDVTKSFGLEHGYHVYLLILYEDVPEEYKAKDDVEAERIEVTIDDLRECLERIGLKNGATWVWKQDDKWFYSGDFTHCPKEDIDSNAKILWKLWRTAGCHIGGCFGMSKAYDRDIYIDLNLETHKDSNTLLPPFTILKGTPSVQAREVRETYKEPVYPLVPEEPEEPIWHEISTYAKILRLADLKDESDWTIETDFLALAIPKQTIPDIVAFCREGRELWQPEYEEFVRRNGGLEILHPIMRKDIIFAWSPEDVVWSEEAETLREMYYRKYSLDELEPLKVADLKKIAISKNLNTKGRKDELITAILEANSKIVTPDEEPS